jgi:DNA-binding transcriptional LysR family regulator
LTLDQLAVFVAVADKQHLTKAASELNLSVSAVSAAIKALETGHGVSLFHRVGRGIELTPAGRRFLGEAKETLARARIAERVLDELAGRDHGVVEIQASQTIANYWLPPRLVRFRELHPNIEIKLQIGNTATVTNAVMSGLAELAFIEGTIDEPALATRSVASDRLVVVTASNDCEALADTSAACETVGVTDLMQLTWVMREPGSGTRAVFEAGLRANGLDPRKLDIVLTLPSNEAVVTAIRSGRHASALSEAVVTPFLEKGELKAFPVSLDLRKFTLLRHKERPLSAVAAAFEEFCRTF